MTPYDTLLRDDVVLQMIMLILIVNFTYSVIGMHLFEVVCVSCVRACVRSFTSFVHRHGKSDDVFVRLARWRARAHGRRSIVPSSRRRRTAPNGNDGRHDGVTAPPPPRRPLSRARATTGTALSA